MKVVMLVIEKHCCLDRYGEPERVNLSTHYQMMGPITVLYFINMCDYDSTGRR